METRVLFLIGLVVIIVAVDSMSKPVQAIWTTDKKHYYSQKIFADSTDKKIIATLRAKWQTRPTRLIMTDKDLKMLASGEIDKRLAALLAQALCSKHNLAVRLIDGYDTTELMITREVEKDDYQHVSAHFKNQGCDIFWADGVEMAWQVSQNPIKRRKAQDKIRALIGDIYTWSKKDKFYLPAQMMTYRIEDMEFFEPQVAALYGTTEMERRYRGIIPKTPCWDRLHIGY